MKVAFILQEDVLNQNSWSGTPYFIYASIKEIIPDIQLLAPLKITSINKIKRKLLRIINRLLFIISKKIILNCDTPDFILKEWSKQVDEYINQNNIELIISTFIFPFVYTKSNFKMVQIADATPILLIKDYQNMLFSDRLIRKKENHSLQVVKKSDLIVSASDWCRDSAVNYYNIDEKKVITIPFGANFDDSEIVYNEKSIDKNKQVNFLFVWKRLAKKRAGYCY